LAEQSVDFGAAMVDGIQFRTSEPTMSLEHIWVLSHLKQKSGLSISVLLIALWIVLILVEATRAVPSPSLLRAHTRD
jgi:hypothetical protein